MMRITWPSHLTMSTIISTGAIILIMIGCLPGVQAAVPTGCLGKMDLTFIMDESESIRDNDPLDHPDQSWDMFKDFVKSLVRGLPVGVDTRVAMVKYSNQAEIIWHLDQYRYSHEIEAAVDGLEHRGGNTNTAEALQKTREQVYHQSMGDRPDARNIIILMTDGLSTVRREDVFQQARWTRDAGVEIYVVAIGRYIDEDELRGITKDYSKYIIWAQDFGRLAAIQDLLLHRVCGLPDPAPPTDTPHDCNRKMDLTFIVDNSGSIRDKNKDNEIDNYQRLKNFLTNMIDQLDIGTDRTRVATVRFSDVAELEFYLNSYPDKDSLKQRLQRMNFRGSDTNTAAAIRLTLSQVYSRNNGDRPDVQDVAILVTDGESTMEKNMTLIEAQIAKRRGLKFYVVGVTDEINEAELRGIASDPDEEFFFDSTDIKYLNSIMYNLINNVCKGSWADS